MEPKEFSWTFKIFIVILSLLLAVFTFYSFYCAITLLYKGIAYHQNIIMFEKTAMYMFGPSIFLFLFAILITKAFITNKKIPDKKIYAYGVFYIPLLLMIILPHIISFFVHQHIDEINYVECKEQSTFKIKYTKYIFAKDLKTCQQYKK